MLKYSFGSTTILHVAQVLEQETAFDSLQWFEAVGAHYAAEAAAVAERPAPDAAAPSLAARFLDGLSSLRGAQGAASWKQQTVAAPGPLLGPSSSEALLDGCWQQYSSKSKSACGLYYLLRSRAHMSPTAPTGGSGSPDRAARPVPVPADEENRQLLLSRVRAYAAEYELLAHTLAGVRAVFAEADE